MSDLTWQWREHSTVKAKVLTKLEKVFSYQEKYTAANTKLIF